MTAPDPLLKRTTCPHCWHRFEPHDALWVAADPSLRGDPRLGEGAFRRFRPARFTARGGAVDEAGGECTELACPHCHLPVPRVCFTAEPWFVSVLGAPAAGKSYFLAAMTHTLRRRLPADFGVDFTDADAGLNRIVCEYEAGLFANPNPDALLPLGGLVAKTQEQGDGYSPVRFGSGVVSYPRPFLFTTRPQPGHPQAADPAAGRVVCLYDNAGESFLAGRDPTPTRHLAEAALLLFLFDPTQHPPFRKKLQDAGEAVDDDRPAGGPQHLVLVEAAGRVRRFAGLPDTARHDRPLVVVVTKQDVWGRLLPGLGAGPPAVGVGKSGRGVLNLDRIEGQSQLIRGLLQQLTPEVVAAADGFARSVTYVGASALGTRPTRGFGSTARRDPPAAGGWAIRPRDIRPAGVEVPLLYGLHRAAPQLVPGGRRPAPVATPGSRS